MVVHKKKYISGDLLKFKSDPLVIKAINLLMCHGKRSKAEKILFQTFQALDKDYPGQSFRIFYSAVMASKQDIAVRLKPNPKKRRRKQSYNVYLPRLITPMCGLSLGIRSLIKASRERSQSSFSPLWESLSQELFQASQNKGGVVAERYRVNKLAISNKRRVHFATRR
uniref:Ribosomal protein S7 n=1 Tax=Cladosiphon okamuranus TaxID=309737 RepID=A0A3G5FPM3_9PHAE|nr:ribosomal protein S7 [Cladosiphon okamuranus]AYW52589.1 ribosomal protein S7 [Cladosiphon okamuranus]